MGNVLVVVEQRNQAIRKAALSAITFGKHAAEKTGAELHLCVLGSGLDALKDEIASYRAKKVWIADSEILKDYLAEPYAAVVTEIAKKVGADTIAATATTFGKDLMPKVAGKLGGAMASDIVGVDFQNGEMIFKRELYAGNAVGLIKLTLPIKVITVRGTEFEPAQKAAQISEIENFPVGLDTAGFKTKFLEFAETKLERPELTEAEVVVSAGRGAKGPDGFKLIEQLADIFNAAIGATRSAVDAGWVPNDWQVGQTGKIVAPDLYFAIGISGAIQHVAGMKGSKVIVAINKDEEAPIFQVADYGLVADMFKAVPELVTEIKKAKG